MASKNINSATMKENNINLVFNAIRESEYISRRDLAQKLGLTSATVTNIVNHLLKKGYLIESGMDESSGGRKPIILSLNPTIGYVVGLELSSTRLNCVITDFRAKIVGEKHIDIDVNLGKDAVLDTVIATIESIISEIGLTKDQILEIGLVTPGPSNFEQGLMVNPPNLPGWYNVPIKNIVEQRTGISVLFEKETAAAAMCEYWFGNAKSSKCLFLCSVLEVGIGSSILIDGKVFHGFRNSSGEIGHMIMDMNGPQCACGNYGCLETIADGRALINNVKKKLKMDTELAGFYHIDDIEKLTITEICERAERGERLFMEEIINCAKYVGAALCNIIVTLSPDTIILAGDLPDLSEMFVEEIKRYIFNRTYPEHNNYINIYHTNFKWNIDALGGVAFVFERIFEKI